MAVLKRSVLLVVALGFLLGITGLASAGDVQVQYLRARQYTFGSGLFIAYVSASDTISLADADVTLQITHQGQTSQLQPDSVEVVPIQLQGTLPNQMVWKIKKAGIVVVPGDQVTAVVTDNDEVPGSAAATVNCITFGTGVLCR